jgi:hypothetical protein
MGGYFSTPPSWLHPPHMPCRHLPRLNSVGKLMREPRRSDGQVVDRTATQQDVTGRNVINTVLIVCLFLEAAGGVFLIGYFWMHSVWLWLAT